MSLSRVTKYVSLAVAVLILIPMSASAAASGEFKESSLSTTSTKPTLSGTAEDTKTVYIVVKDEDTDKVVYTSKNAKVSKKGIWRAKIHKKLKYDTYTIELYSGKKSDGELIETEELVVSKKKAKMYRNESASGSSSKSSSSSSSSKAKDDTTLAFTSVPLLGGGQAKLGTSVPVAYIKVDNTGKEAASIEGFTLTQRGSAPTSAVIGFSTSDNKGGSRTTIGGSAGDVVFKSGSAYIPLEAAIPAGEFRIFTLKAILASGSTSALGTTLVLDVESVNSTATNKGSFPIKGTTWQITQ
jgi:hypothetical protein